MSTGRTAQEWYELGYTRRADNDLEGAREAFEMAVGTTRAPLSAAARAGALRALGELADVRDDVVEAVRQYRRALEVDPKIGVSKRLKALERLRHDPRTRRRIVSRRV